MAELKITAENFENEVLHSEKPVLLDFYADWCGPCKMMAPVVEECAKEYSGKVDFYKIDVDKEKELAQTFGIQSIPTFLFIPVSGKPNIPCLTSPPA